MNEDFYITISCIYKRATDKAALLSVNDVEFWCPFSCMHIVSEQRVEQAYRNDELELQIREWKLKAEGVFDA